MENNFSAPYQALGYLYQVRYALWVILQHLDSELSIEFLDDITFRQDGSPYELLQLKHHVKRRASLQDSSDDLWKTLRVWSQALRSESIEMPGTVLALITTASVPENTVASLLCSDQRRDPERALTKILSYIEGSKSKDESRLAAYKSFEDLTKEQQMQLLQSVRIVPDSPDIVTVEELIKERVQIAVRPQNMEPFVQRLEGWWFQRVIDQLNTGTQNHISGYEVHTQINSIAEQFLPNALPIDYLLDDPSDLSPDTDTRQFVHQLRLIAIGNSRIGYAIRDYHRAFTQRSRWVGDQLVSISELQQYERRLIEEWNRHFALVNENPDDVDRSEDALKRRGRMTYDWMEQTAQINIRKNCQEPYVMRGSFHLLADDNPPKLGWHPDFEQRLKVLLEGARS